MLPLAIIGIICALMSVVNTIVNSEPVAIIQAQSMSPIVEDGSLTVHPITRPVSV